MVSAAVAAFAPFSVNIGLGVTLQCDRPLMLAFASDETGTCRWSMAQSRCILALMLVLLALVLVAVALIRLSRNSYDNDRFVLGLGQLLLLGLSGAGSLALVGLSVAALTVGPGGSQGI